MLLVQVWGIADEVTAGASKHQHCESVSAHIDVAVLKHPGHLSCSRFSPELTAPLHVQLSP